MCTAQVLEWLGLLSAQVYSAGVYSTGAGTGACTAQVLPGVQRSADGSVQRRCTAQVLAGVQRRCTAQVVYSAGAGVQHRCTAQVVYSASVQHRSTAQVLVYSAGVHSTGAGAGVCTGQVLAGVQRRW